MKECNFIISLYFFLEVCIHHEIKMQRGNYFFLFICFHLTHITYPLFEGVGTSMVVVEGFCHFFFYLSILFFLHRRMFYLCILFFFFFCKKRVTSLLVIWMHGKGCNQRHYSPLNFFLFPTVDHEREAFQLVLFCFHKPSSKMCKLRF